jgi:hypothetical protein
VMCGGVRANKSIHLTSFFIFHATKQTIKMSQKTKKQYIPDVSYHLIFCFLQLEELSLIAQCSKDFKRIVMDPSFVNMFHHSDVLEIKDEEDIKRFRHVIRKAKMDTQILCRLSRTNFLHRFNRLESLDLTIDFADSKNFDYDITPVFQALGPKLRQLKVIIYEWPIGALPPLSFLQFQNALCHLESLTSLNLNNYLPIFTNVSFLTKMIHLQTFICNSPTKKMIKCLSFLPELTHLGGFSFTGGNHSINELKELCMALSKTKLIHLGRFQIGGSNYDSAENYQSFLKTLNHLETIDIIAFGNYAKIPSLSLLGKWVDHLHIYWRSFKDEDVSTIINLPNLKSIKLERVFIQNFQLEVLISGLSSRLEKLEISDMCHNEISFGTLSKCTKLKSHILKNVFIQTPKKHKTCLWIQFVFTFGIILFLIFLSSYLLLINE